MKKCSLFFLRSFRFEKIFLFLSLILFLQDVHGSDADEKTLEALPVNGINVIPLPAKIEPGEGVFTLTAETGIVVSPDAKEIGTYLAGVLSPSTGFPLSVVSDNPSDGRSGQIALLLAGDNHKFGEEGYEQQVIDDRIIIRAAQPAGLFYGCQSLRQLFPFQIESPNKVTGVEWAAPVVRIFDKPRLEWGS